MTKVKDTSLESYKKLKLSEAQQRVLDYFLVIRGYMATYKDLVKHTGYTSDQRRISELVDMGRIKPITAVDGCMAYTYVWSKAERERLRQLHATKKPEIERYTAWLHQQRLKQHGDGWYGKVEGKHGEYSHKQMVKAFKQSEKLNSQIIW